MAFLNGHLVIEVADGLSQPARTRVQHDVNVVVFVGLEFDEMVTAAKSTERRSRFVPPFGRDWRIGACCHGDNAVFEVPYARIAHGLGVPAEPSWHPRCDNVDGRLELVPEVIDSQTEWHHGYAATHIDAHSVRDNGAISEHHAPNWDAKPKVRIRHQRYVVYGHWQVRDITRLFKRPIFEDRGP